MYLMPGAHSFCKTTAQLPDPTQGPSGTSETMPESDGQMTSLSVPLPASVAELVLEPPLPLHAAGIAKQT